MIEKNLPVLLMGEKDWAKLKAAFENGQFASLIPLDGKKEYRGRLLKGS
jgi:hypothetical protein